MAEQLIVEFKPIVGQRCSIESVVLVPGGGGVFDVRCDGELIYSKHITGRFPALEEIASPIWTIVER